MKAQKKLIYLTLCLILILSVFPAAAFAADDTMNQFTDMPEDWSKAGLLKAVENGLLTGFNGKIMPKDFLTRAQMAAVLNKAFGATNKGNLSNYSDVPASKWYFSDMALALEMGTFEGSNGKMRPDDFITREEVFAVIAKALMLSDGDAEKTMKFPDYTQISPWAMPFVAVMVENGYVNGSNGMLYPKKNITRAEFAALMNNLIKYYIREAGTYTGDYDGTLMVSARDVILKDMVIDGDLIIGDGVGDGEVTLDNVTVMGRTIIRGLAQLADAGIDIIDEGPALGAALPVGDNTGGDGGNTGGDGGGTITPPPATSIYGFRLIKEAGTQTTVVLVDEYTFNDSDKVNFQMVSTVYDRGNSDFIAAITDHTDFIERALKLTSERSSKPYAYTLTQRVLNYPDRANLKVLNTAGITAIFEQIDANADENATSEQVKAMVDFLLGFSLADIVSDLEQLYPNIDDFVPADFSIWTYNGSTLVKQDQLLIKDIKTTLDNAYKNYSITELVGKRIMMVEFGDEKVYLEIVRF